MFTSREAFIEAERVVDSFGLTAAALGALSDTELIEVTRAAAHLVAKVQRLTAVASSEIARRSDKSLGSAGLTARLGMPRVADFIQHTTGGTKHDTATLLTSGKVMADTEFARDAARLREADPDAGVPASAAIPPWFSSLSDALADGALSMAVVDGIRAGLGATTGLDGALVLNLTRSSHRVTFEGAEERAAREAAETEYETAIVLALPTLIEECRVLTPEAAQKASRLVRAQVDSAGLLHRSIAQGRAQYLKVFPKPDGMLGVSALLGPEYAAVFLSLHEQLRHPRRAGRDFLTPDDWDLHRANNGDLRDIDEYTVDAFMDILCAGVTIDPSRMLDVQPPAVRVVCTLAELDAHSKGGKTGGSGTGHGQSNPGFGIITSTNEPIPLETIDRAICSGGIQGIRFDDNGQSMNVGRTERYFTPKQRIALEIRDGGCMDPGCDRPVSWTEAHHITHWHRDTGPTNLTNGILLCHAHHRRYHNHGYEIEHTDGHYWLIPPKQIDPQQTRQLMRSKSALHLHSPVHLPHPAALAAMPPLAALPTPAG